MAERKYGWRPSLPDYRDLELHGEVPSVAGVAVPRSVDNRQFCDGPWDQSQIGSCTAHGTGMCYVACGHHQGFTVSDPSRLFLYYNARAREGTTRSDSGATCRDATAAVAQFGAPAEALWPYDIAKFARKPPVKAFTEGLKHQGLQYLAVTQSTLPMQQALAAGYCVIVGFSVYDAFESAQVASTGLVDLPKRGERLLGGHCTLLVGYDMDNPRLWLLRNSWGANWGMGGDFRMPETYLTNPKLAGDFWTFHSVEG